MSCIWLDYLVTVYPLDPVPREDSVVNLLGEILAKANTAPVPTNRNAIASLIGKCLNHECDHIHPVTGTIPAIDHAEFVARAWENTFPRPALPELPAPPPLWSAVENDLDHGGDGGDLTGCKPCGEKTEEGDRGEQECDFGDLPVHVQESVLTIVHYIERHGTPEWDDRWSVCMRKLLEERRGRGGQARESMADALANIRARRGNRP